MSVLRPARSRGGSTGCRGGSCTISTGMPAPARWDCPNHAMLPDTMDDIVKQAMAKWPNVPHCYGWLALDARGGWRMRDEAAQRANAAGDRLNNPALVGF